MALPLQLTTGSYGWGGCGATIIPDANSHVWGTVWKIGNEHMQALDDQEGVSSRVYEPLQVEVALEGNTKLTCRTYQLVPERLGPDGQGKGIPSLLYKSVIVAGARQNNLPSSYITFLENL